MADTLVVLIDGDELPELRRDGDGITEWLESMTMLAAVGA
jgi:hypothetical protein